MLVTGLLKALDVRRGYLPTPTPSSLQCELEEKLSSFKISHRERNGPVNLAK